MFLLFPMQKQPIGDNEEYLEEGLLCGSEQDSTSQKPFPPGTKAVGAFCLIGSHVVREGSSLLE